MSDACKCYEPPKPVLEKKQLEAIIVEDEPVTGEIIRLAVERLGYKVSFFIGAKEAIESAKTSRPDLVVLDIKIKSELNGVETAVVIQGMYEAPMPVLFVTAYPETDFPLLNAVKPYVYLQKVFADQELVNALSTAVRLQA